MELKEILSLGNIAHAATFSRIFALSISTRLPNFLANVEAIRKLPLPTRGSSTELSQHMLAIYSHMYLQINLTPSRIENVNEKVLRFLSQRILRFYHVRRKLPSIVLGPRVGERQHFRIAFKFSRKFDSDVEIERSYPRKCCRRALIFSSGRISCYNGSLTRRCYRMTQRGPSFSNSTSNIRIT